MRRKKEDKIYWIKRGGGSFRARIDGRLKIIKPNEKFWARENEIPEAFRDTIEPVDETQKQEVQSKKTPNSVQEAIGAEAAEPEFDKKHVGAGWFEVFNTETGKVMNEVKLKKEDADELIKQLSS